MLRVLLILSLLVGLPGLAAAQVAQVKASGIEGEFNWRAVPDDFWLLRLKMNQTYECVHRNGWSGDTAYATGTYKLVSGRIRLAIKRRPIARSLYADAPTFSGKRFYVYQIPVKLLIDSQNRVAYRGVMYDESWQARGSKERYVLSAEKITVGNYSLKE